MPSPFSRLSPRRRKPALFVLLAVSLGLFALLTVQGRPLRTPAAPLGILSYEFALNEARAQEILRSWSGIEETARRQIWLDFPFLVAYPLLLSLACSLAAESGPRAGLFLSWAVLAAGPLDAAENLFLLRMLDSGASGAAALAAALCASVKFLLVFAAAGGIVLGRRRRST